MLVKIQCLYRTANSEIVCYFAGDHSLKASKTVAITPIMGHWRFEETNQESLDWIKNQLEK